MAETEEKKPTGETQRTNGVNETEGGGASDHSGASADLDCRPERRESIVTVFGAGITGLSAAHELVERGFTVQVVESAADVRNEYEVEVGGIAANQWGCVNAEPARVHPHLFEGHYPDYIAAVKQGEIVDKGVKDALDLNENEVRKRRDALTDLRDTPMQKTHAAAYLVQRIYFKDKDKNKDQKKDEKWDPWHHDDHGVTNEVKLVHAGAELAYAFIRGIRRLRNQLQIAEQFAGRDLRHDLKENDLRRETLLVEVRGQTNPDVPPDKARPRGLERARQVLDKLNEQIKRALKRQKEEVEHALRSKDRALKHQYARGYASDVCYVFAHTDLGKEFRAADLAGGTLENLPDDKIQRVLDVVDKVHEGIEQHLVAVSLGAAKAGRRRLTRREKADRVDFQVVESRLPGEHGYRYFPAYYRHLFDTMRRTPILKKNRVIGETAFDQLVTPPPVTVSLKNSARLESVARQGYRSIEEIRNVLHLLFKKMKLTQRDADLSLLQLFKFMTSCERRRRTYEELSWLEFLDDRKAHTCESLRGKTRFSREAEELICETPQALAAMSAEETDALTYGITGVQLMLDPGKSGGHTDMTLNGPTSTAWLDPWKLYLKRQGVRFFSGELTDFSWDRDHGLIPVVEYRPRHGVARLGRKVVLVRHKGGVDANGVLAAFRELDPGAELLADPPGSDAWFIELDTHAAEALGKRENDGWWIAPVLPVPEDARHVYHGYRTQSHVELACNLESHRRRRAEPQMPDFYILALSFDAAAKLVWRARRKGIPLDNDLEKLATFDDRCVRRIEYEDETAVEPEKLALIGEDEVQAWVRPRKGPCRDPLGRPSRWQEYPLRDLSGIQFFFRQRVRIGEGHVLYPYAPWGLSSISQLDQWRDRLSPREGFLGHVSVDIGDFYQQQQVDTRRSSQFLRGINRHFLKELETKKTVWECEWWEIPIRCWDQILATLDPRYAQAVDPPSYFHLDSSIMFQEGPPEEYLQGKDPRSYRPRRPRRNRTPFLLNLPGQWQYRPGLSDQWSRFPGRPGRDEPRVWYEVSNDRWLLAGTYMATYTRLMTMEACNESARHAVNALLRQVLESRDRHTYAGAGRLRGDFCQIWDPGEHEIPDLEPLRRLDDALFEDGIPHLVDVLGLTKLVEQMSPGDRERPVANLSRLLSAARESTERDWGFLGASFDPYGVPSSSELERKLHAYLEDVLKQYGQTLEQFLQGDAAKRMAGLVRDFWSSVAAAGSKGPGTPGTP